MKQRVSHTQPNIVQCDESQTMTKRGNAVYID
jgi:hypothetical protein